MAKDRLTDYLELLALGEVLLPPASKSVSSIAKGLQFGEPSTQGYKQIKDRLVYSSVSQFSESIGVPKYRSVELKM